MKLSTAKTGHEQWCAACSSCHARWHRLQLSAATVLYVFRKKLICTELAIKSWHQSVKHMSCIDAEHIAAQPAQNRNRTPNAQSAEVCRNNAVDMARTWSIPSCIGPISEGSLGEWRGNFVHLRF